MSEGAPDANKHRTVADTSAAVNEFMVALKHPLKTEINALRTIAVGVDASIAEGIKWNAPSFRTTEYFPSKLLRWLAKDRAIVEFKSLKDIQDNGAALRAVLRQWIKYV